MTTVETAPLKAPPAHHAWFLFGLALTLAAFARPFADVANLSFHDERYSHLLLIPAISGALIYFDRRKIFSVTRFSPVTGLLPLSIAALLYAMGVCFGGALSRNILLPIGLAEALTVLIAVFTVVYGKEAFRRAAFPLLFTLLMIPIPDVILDYAVARLQFASAEMTRAIFTSVGLPVYAQGLTFSLPGGVDIEIARECSGIRSATALLITSILAGYMFVESSISWGILIVLTLPIAILKNAIRIVTISLLGIYVDRGFFYGNLHRNGGLPFSIIAIGMMLSVIYALKKMESRTRRGRSSRAITLPRTAASRSGVSSLHQ